MRSDGRRKRNNNTIQQYNYKIMASLTIRLAQRAKKDGLHAVEIRISHRCTNAIINTGVCTEEENFDPSNKYAPINRRTRSAAMKNEQIASIIRKYDEVVFELQRSETTDINQLTATDIREYVVSKKTQLRKASPEKAGQKTDFMAWFWQYGNGRKSDNTQKHYAYVHRVLRRYMDEVGLDCILFADIDYQFLTRLKVWTEREIGVPTRYKMESYIRAAYREAQRMRLVSRDSDPWQDYKIERTEAPERIEYADIKDLKKMMSADLRGQQGEQNLELARDIVTISWCLCGANLIDIYNMPKPEGDELVFTRHKLQTRTKKKMRIHIEPELARLMKKYKGKDHAFSFCEHVKTWDTFQRRVTDRLERFEELYGINVRLNKIRRSWATYARKERFDAAVVDRSMGHLDQSVLGRFYADYDWSATAECNKHMIGFLLGGVRKNSVLPLRK